MDSFFDGGRFGRRAFVAAIAVLAAVFDGFGRGDVPEESPSFGDVAQWIGGNVHFPEDAVVYGTAGRERFVVGLAWDGRVFISGLLNTLNPAFEREIKEVVAHAPRFRADGSSNAVVELDFAAMIPEADKGRFRDVGVHSSPVFRGAKVSDDSRRMFVEWLSERYAKSRRAEVGNRVDTVSLVYTVSPSGELENCAVSACGDSRLGVVLERLMRRSPQWTPARTIERQSIAVTVCDRVIVRADAGGECRLELVRDDVCRNTSAAPADLRTIVSNPEVCPRLQGDYTNLGRAIAGSVDFDAKTEYTCTFVVERDGSVSELQVKTTAGEHVARAIADVVRDTRWSPAMQGGEAVRCAFGIGDLCAPQRETERMYAAYGNVPHFMTEGSRAPFDSESQRSRWKRFKRAYPDAAASVYGYREFRRMDNLGYIESLTARNALHGEPKKVEKRRR